VQLGSHDRDADEVSRLAGTVVVEENVEGLGRLQMRRHEGLNRVRAALGPLRLDAHVDAAPVQRLETGAVEGMQVRAGL
jgi:hypothetical protein